MSDATPDRASDSHRVDALRLLVDLGWRFLDTADALALRGGTRETILRPRLVDVLQTRRFDYRGQPHPLSPGGIDQIVREVQALNLVEGLLPANERLYRLLTLGVTVTEFMPDGRTHRPTVALVDWERPDANRWDVTAELQVLSAHGTHHRTADVVGYVNGLPLVVIGTPRPDAGQDGRSGLDEVVRRQLRDQRHDGIPGLFACAQLLLALGDGDARYGTTGTAFESWARWREEASDDMPSAQDRLPTALLRPERLLEFLRLFVLFDREAGKVVARPAQFFGVRALLARIRQRRPDGAREGGVVRHAAGSGRRLAMMFAARALLLHPSTQACRVLIVTDRLDLEDRLAHRAVDGDAAGAYGGKPRPGSGRALALRIGAGTERLVFASFRSLAAATKRPECRNPSADVVVLVDGGHRGPGDAIHARLRAVLPRAAFVAFAGTPPPTAAAAAAERPEGPSAHGFGPLVHAYAMQRAVDDGAVVPLFYEERLLAPPDDGADGDRIGPIARDIARHFRAHVGALGPGLKGLVATASKLDAVRYQRCLDATGLVRSAVVVSAPDRREGDTGIDESAIPDVQAWWHANAGRNARAREAKVLEDFGSDGAPELLIVVDRLLTGLDEPRNAILYIDRPLPLRTLMQALGQVNRLHAGKRCGLLVDYRGSLKELEPADIGGVFRKADLPSTGLEAREPPGVYRVRQPAGLDGPAPASAYLAICRRMLGVDGFATADAHEWAKRALVIDDIVGRALAEHSLHPQDAEASIRKALLPLLFASMGLDGAKDAIAQVIRVARPAPGLEPRATDRP